MVYLATYLNCNKQHYSEFINAEDLTIADIRSKINANRIKGTVVSVKPFDFVQAISEAISLKSSHKVVNIMQRAFGKVLFLNYLDDLTSLFDLEVQFAAENERWIVYDNHIISFVAEYNVYGLCEIKDIIIYDHTDSILSSLKVSEVIA